MIESSQTIAKIAAALVAAQAELKNPPKDSVNPHYRSRYADLATVLDTVRPILAKHRLAVLQLPCTVETVAMLTTMLIHESGEYIRSTFAMHQVKNDPQGIGSAMTYARRYGLQSVLGIAADDDDDGENASKQPPQQNRSAPGAPRPAPQQAEPNPKTALLDRIAKASTQEHLDSASAEVKRIAPALSQDDLSELRSAFAARSKAIQPAPATHTAPTSAPPSHSYADTPY